MDFAFREFLTLFSLLALLPMGIITLGGLAISILQAATQIQEQSLAFAVKIIGFLLLLAIGAPLSLSLLTEFLERSYLASARVGALP
jgi:flagellar biosynthesis protein FliQ